MLVRHEAVVRLCYGAAGRGLAASEWAGGSLAILSVYSRVHRRPVPLTPLQPWARADMKRKGFWRSPSGVSEPELPTQDTSHRVRGR